MPDFVAISTTVDSEADAERLASLLVESRLAACVQRLPIHSVYRWKDAVESADEYLLLAKTKAALIDAVVDFMKTHDIYELREIVVTPILGGLSAYLNWLGEETQ